MNNKENLPFKNFPKKGGFFDLPKDKVCKHTEHKPPMHICIPHGKGYRHVCPECGEETIIIPQQVSLSDSAPKTEWVKCHHGHELRYGKCEECQKEIDEMFKIALKVKNDPPKKIAIRRGCNHGDGGCFCSGACKEIIGYRDPLYPGEKQH